MVLRNPILLVPFLALIALAAGLGLALGRKAGPPDEGRAIARVAAQYVERAGAGAAMTDCVGSPGLRDGTWIVVTCQFSGDGGRVYRYDLDQWGRVLPQAEAGPEAPHL